MPVEGMSEMQVDCGSDERHVSCVPCEHLAVIQVHLFVPRITLDSIRNVRSCDLMARVPNSSAKETSYFMVCCIGYWYGIPSH